MDELLPIVNEKDEEIGTAAFSTVHTQGLLHREAYIYILSHGRVLLQRRADNDKWDVSSSGHCAPGEAYIDAARRECREEIGVVLEKDTLREIVYMRMDGVKPGKKNNRFLKMYVAEYPARIFTLDPAEVKEVRYFTKEEVVQLLSKENVTNTARHMLGKLILPLLK